jgi:hypothetical protein
MLALLLGTLSLHATLDRLASGNSQRLWPARGARLSRAGEQAEAAGLRDRPISARSRLGKNG